MIADRTPDLIAFGITLLMTCVLALGASKSVIFNNTLNAINFATWVFIMTAGLFYIDTDVWHEHDGFLPFGWSGVSGHHNSDKYLLFSWCKQNVVISVLRYRFSINFDLFQHWNLRVHFCFLPATFFCVHFSIENEKIGFHGSGNMLLCFHRF